MKISRFTINMFGVNCYVVWDEKSRQAVVIDPGMFYPREHEVFDNFLKKNDLTLTQIVNTHLHLDHIFGVNALKDKYGVKAAGGAADAPLGATIGEMAARFGLKGDFKPVELDVTLKPGDRIPVGDEFLEVISVPGHSKGSIALYAPESGVVFTGDALFKGSIGRTDLPGGDFGELVGSIKQNLLTLPDETVILPGHGEETTVGEEKRHNQFLR